MPHEQQLAMSPSASRPLLPGSLEVMSLAMQFLESPLVMKAPTLCFKSVTVLLPSGTEPSFSQNSSCMVSIWNSKGSEGPALWQQLAWRDVTLPSTHGIYLVEAPFQLAYYFGLVKYQAPPEMNRWQQTLP